MRSRIGYVKEERSFCLGGIVNICQGSLCDVLRHVKVIGQVFRLEQSAVFTEGTVRHGLVIVRRSAQEPAVAVEASVPGIGSPDFSQMPFSGQVGAVAGFFQQFRQGGNVRFQAPPVAGTAAVVVQQPHVHFVGFAPGHDGGPGGGTAGGRVASRSLHSLPGERVDVGSGYFRTVAAQIGPAHVVG